MRKNVKALAPTLWIVIAAFIIAIFAVWGGAGRLGESRAANTLVTVGKEKISADFYFQNLKQRLELLKREFKDLDSNFIQQLNIPQQVLEQIIQQTLLIQSAEEMGIKASDEEIKQKIMSYPVFQQDGKFIGFENYKKILDWNRIPLSEFEESLKKEIIIEKAIKSLTSGIAVTEKEIWDNYKNTNESAKLEFVVIETDSLELDWEPKLSELQDFYEKNKGKYKIPEKREGLFVFFNTEDLKDEIQLSDSDIEDYYKKNQAQFREPEKVRVNRIFLTFEGNEKEFVLAEAQNILGQIQKGANFGDLARKYSKDEKAENNGDWGFFEWQRLSPVEQEEIRKLQKNEVSRVIELDEGASILMVTEKEESFLKPLEQVRGNISSILQEKIARELAEKKVRQLEKNAKKVKSLDAAAQKLGYKAEKTGLLTDGKSLPDIDPSGAISMELFKLDDKKTSSPIYTYKGVGLTQLEKIEPPRPALFEEVKEDIKEELLITEKQNAAIERLQGIKAELPKKNLEQLAKAYGLEYKTAEEHKRGQYLSIIGENDEVDRLVFSLPLNEPSDPIEFDGGFVLVRPLSRKEVSKEEFEKVKDEEREKALEAKKKKFLHSCLLKLREDKGVKIKYDLFLKINSDILSRYSIEK
ncbi:MAG: SurA N-terminal domain-containing protein [Acidobacteriota bacterium]|nr:SurA N-terminal domain-containing protein [Acidobacteriota bacterium]